MGIVLHAVGKAHLLQQRPAVSQNGIFALAGLFRFRHQLTGQCHVFQCRVLREQVEALEHQTKMQAFFTNVRLTAGVRVGSVKQRLAPNGDHALIRRLQEIQAPQQRGFAAAG